MKYKRKASVTGQNDFQLVCLEANFPLVQVCCHNPNESKKLNYFEMVLTLTRYKPITIFYANSFLHFMRMLPILTFF